tara:strand:+ start:73 stop:999 length:927 start_codon:yes stop_codon:yes gene_type:complete
MNLGNVEKQTSLEEENITDDIIWNEVLKILRDNKDNIDNITVKSIRKLAEKNLNIDLKEKKTWLKKKLTLWYENQKNIKEDEDVEDEDVEDENVEDENVEDVEDEDVEDEDIEDEVVDYQNEQQSDEDEKQDDEKDDIEEDDISIDEPKNKISSNTTQISLEKITNTINNLDSDEELSSDDEENDYLQKLNNNNLDILNYHPETLSHNYNEISKLSKITKDEFGNIVDPLHKTIPFISKYEYTKVLGQRAKQLEQGAQPFIKIDEFIIDPYIIAKQELENKKLPFIIKRPLPGSGFEYWHLEDLEILI